MSRYSGVLTGVDCASLVEQCLQRLDSPLEPTAVDHLVDWIVELDRWNQRTDLTAARTAEQLVDLAVADAVVLARAIPHSASVVDIGTGAGAPGLPLAILRPDLSVILVEPLRKRVAFLRSVLGRLGLEVDVVPTRAEQWIEQGRAVDVAISRATLEPSAWLELACSLVHTQGRSAVLLARRSAPEDLEKWSLLECTTYRWPLTDVERRCCWYERNTTGGG